LIVGSWAALICCFDDILPILPPFQMEEHVEEEGQVEGGLDTDRDDEVSEEEGEDLMEVSACVNRA
jgi:hypothetical protein